MACAAHGFGRAAMVRLGARGGSPFLVAAARAGGDGAARMPLPRALSEVYREQPPFYVSRQLVALEVLHLEQAQ